MCFPQRIRQYRWFVATPILFALTIGPLVLRNTFLGSILSAKAATQTALTFTLGHPLATARGFHTATLLQNGQVLVVGGNSSGGYLSSTELYDPASGVWSAAAGLSSTRHVPTAALLRNGRVLLTGGVDGNGATAAAEVYDPVANVWTGVSGMSTSRYYHTMTLLKDGRVLVVAGNGGPGGGVTLSSAEIYNAVTNTWSSAGDIGTGLRFHTATLLPDGRVLIAGGRDQNENDLALAQIFDPANNSWSAVPNMLAPRHAHTATLLPNGRVLVAGGYGSGGVLQSAEIYDPVANTWSAAGSLSEARHAHTAALLPNGKVLVLGGHNPAAQHFISSAEVYDLATNAWASAGNLNEGRRSHTATLLPNGKVLVTGGQGNGGAYLASTELHNIFATGSWGTVGNLNTARFAHAATLLPNGKVLVVGGANAVSYFASAELYDSATSSWNAAADLSRARQSHTATLLANGKVLIAGGYDNTSIAQAELYDPVTNTWTSAGTMLTGRHNHTATLLPDGRVLVAGGLSNNNGEPLISLNTAEIYNPATNTWSAAANLNVHRRRHTATLLLNGKVLVAGGREETLTNTASLASAEIYDPLTNSWSLTGSLNQARAFFSSTLLPNGKVLAVGGEREGAIELATAELYDPNTQTWGQAASLSQARSYQTATLTPDGKVLIAGDAPTSGSPILTTELYDPIINTWRVTGSLNTGRYLYTATLLPTGQVLAVGGMGNGNAGLSSSELYDLGLGFANAWRPTLNNPPSMLVQGTALTLQGNLFQDISEASSGGYNNSATNYPLVQLRSLANEQMVFLSVDATVGWANTSFTSRPVNGFPTGHALVTVFANAIPSLAAVTKIGTPTTITAQPISQTVCQNNSTTFSVAAAGLGTLSYQWRKNGVHIVGANSATLLLPSVAAIDSGSYDVVITSAYDATTSSAATLTVNPLTGILTQPVSQTVCEKTSVTFSVAAAGAGLSYQWRRNGVNIVGATAATYTQNNAQPGHAGNYDVVVTGTCGIAVSAVATLTVNTVPVITQHPTSQTVPSGTIVTFSAAATSTTPLSIQWQVNTSRNTYSDIPGATSATLQVTASTATNGNRYQAVFTNSCGAETSQAARLRLSK